MNSSSLSRLTPPRGKYSRPFGQTQRAPTKTDALLIARFAQMHQPEPWQPSSPEVYELRALVRRLEALDEMWLMEENRPDSGGLTAVVETSLRCAATSLS